MSYIKENDAQIKSFINYVNEDIDTDGNDRKRALDRSTTERMLGVYGLDSDVAKHVRKVAKGRGEITNQYATVYPCYRASGEANSYIFYDGQTGRAFEVFKPIDSPNWVVRFGDKSAENTTDATGKSVAANLKSNFTKIYDMWEDRAIENMKTKNLAVTPSNTQENVVKMLANVISQMREWNDLTDLRKTLVPINGLDNAKRTLAHGYTDVKNDPLNVVSHEKSLGDKGYKQWYEKNIGKLAATTPSYEKTSKKSTIFGNAKIAEIIKGLGLLTAEHTAKYDNIELMRLFNAIIQENPYASNETKKRWRETLKKLYQKYNILNTEGIDLSNEEYYGPELYKKEIANHINNPEIRKGLRIELWGMLTNFVLAGENLRSPNFKSRENSTEKYAGDDLKLKSDNNKMPKRGLIESAPIPTFLDFLFEGKGRQTFIIRFSADVTESELMAIDGVVSAKKSSGANTWEITSDYDTSINDAIYDFAFEKKINILEVREKNEMDKNATGEEAYKQKRQEKMGKLLTGKYAGRKVGAVSNRELEWMKATSKQLKGGIYSKDQNDERFIREIIFDAVDTLGGFVDIKLNSANTGYYSVIIPTPDHIKDFIPSHLMNQFVLKTDEGYVAYGVPPQGKTQQYFSIKSVFGSKSKYTVNQFLERFDSKEEAETAAKEYDGSKPVVVDLGSEITNELTENYNSIKSKYGQPNTANNLFYIDPSNESNLAEEAWDKGKAAARSTNNMEIKLRYSFLEAAARAVLYKSAEASGVEAGKKATLTYAKTAATSGNYDTVRTKDPKVAGDIEKYGTDPDVVNDSTPGEYLDKSAELINGMEKLGVEKNVIRELVHRWNDMAEMSMELGGKKMEGKINDLSIPDELVEELKTSLSNKEELEQDKIQYMLTMAFLQMLIRDIGAVHIEHALTGWGGKSGKSEESDSAVETLINKYTDSDALSKVNLAELWKSYMDAVNVESNKLGDDKQDEIAQLRSKLIEIAVDAAKDADVPEDQEDSFNKEIGSIEDTDPFYDIMPEDYTTLLGVLNTLGPKASAIYKTKLRNEMYKFKKQEA